MNQDIAQLTTEMTDATADAIRVAPTDGRRWVDMSRLLKEVQQSGHDTWLDLIDELDQIFPLSQGSHRDVCEYVIYFQQLLAFFNDGSSSGLLNPGQFVALDGHKEEPESVLLRQGDYHLELEFNRVRSEQTHPLANMMVEVELAQGDDIISPALPSLRACLQTHKDAANDGYVALTAERIFRAADGGDYVLHNQRLV